MDSFFFFPFFFFAHKGVPLWEDSKARREGVQKKGVGRGEGDESTPKPVAAKSIREVYSHIFKTQV